MDQSKTTSEHRRHERLNLDCKVTVDLDPLSIVGPGENISREGVFFVIDGRIRATVTIEGRDEVLQGELVRIQSMGAGRTGIAVRFDDPIEES